jgi:hypothetical protein
MKTSKPFITFKKFLLGTFVVANLVFFFITLWGAKPTKSNSASSIHKVKQYDFSELKVSPLAFLQMGLVKDKKVVLRLMKNDCHECIDSIFNNTVRLSTILGRSSVIVLIDGTYDESKYLTWKRLYQYNFDLYQVSARLTSLDDQGNSYYFILNKNKPKTAQKIYKIFDKMDAGYSPSYNKWAAQL